MNDLLKALQERADANGDGAITADDLGALREQFGNNDLLSALQDKIDTTGDGKISLNDASGLLGNLGDALGGLKDKLFGK